MPDITIHTIETAPEEVKDVLQTVKDANGGFIPNLIGLLANAPTALETYRTVGEKIGRASCRERVSSPV